VLGIEQFLPSNDFTKNLAKYVCGNTVLENACAGFMFLIAGFNTGNMNRTRIPAYVAHTPAGTSVKDVLHFSQVGIFKKYAIYLIAHHIRNCILPKIKFLIKSAS